MTTFISLIVIMYSRNAFTCRFYDGGYLHLKSTIMRTHGAKELRDTIIATPRQNMSKIVEVCHFVLFLLLRKPVLCSLASTDVDILQ